MIIRHQKLGVARPSVLVCAALTVSILLTSVRSSAELKIVTGLGETRSKGALVERADKLVKNRAVELGIDVPDAALQYIDTVDYRGEQFVRFRQRIGGLPVFGSKIIVHATRTGRLSRIVANGIRATSPTTPAISPSDATMVLETQLNTRCEKTDAVLGYLPMGDTTVLAYRVAAMTPGPRLWLGFVCADTGRLLLLHDETKHHQANVYPENPVVSPDLVSVELEDISPEVSHMYHTHGAYARVASCTQGGVMGCQTWDQLAVATAADGFSTIVPEPNGYVFSDGFAEVNGYYLLNKVQKWYRSEFGFAGLFMDAEVYQNLGTLDPQEHIWMYVNVNWANGAFLGGALYGFSDTITLGFLNGSDLAYDADVVFHEFTHGVSSRVFNLWTFDVDELGSDLSAGGIEEGTADYFAASLNGNSVVGEFAAVGRDLENQRRCPEDIIGESHHDGWIAGGTMWSIRTGIGHKKADHLQYSTLVGYPIHSFEDWGEALLDRAAFMASAGSGLDEELVLSSDDVSAVEQAINARNLIGCERIIELVAGGAPASLFVSTAVNKSQGTPSPVQYLVTTDAEAEVLRVEIKAVANKDYDVLVREGEPVKYTWIKEPFLHWQADYDMAYLAVDQVGTPVKISNTTELLLQKDTSYYFSVIARPSHDSPHQSTLSAEFSNEPEPTTTATDTGTATETTTDTGTGTDTVVPNPESPDLESSETIDESSCSCRSVGAHNSTYGLGFWLSVLVVVGGCFARKW